MIYTITFNPALDYITQVENFKTGEINRTKTETILPGGKGLNVSIVLKNLGIENTALGFVAGFTGEELIKKLEAQGVKTDFVKVKEGITRINVKISSLNNNKVEETALNGMGPQITKENIDELLKKISNMIASDFVILSGNIPKNLENNIYEKICKILKEKGITFIVDSTQDLLINVLKYNPFLIKPNKEELEETVKCNIHTKEDIINSAKTLQEMGAQNVLVSLGNDGAILITKEGETYFSEAPKGQVINTVGAGDSMVAGFLAGYYKTKDYEYALKMGVSAGSASAFSVNLATKEEVDSIFNQL
mgnify:FL=1